MPRLLYELPNAPSDANLEGREKHPSVKIRTMPQSHAILSKTKRKGRTDRVCCPDFLHLDARGTVDMA